MSIRPAAASKTGSVLLWSVSFAASTLLLAFSPYSATAAGDNPPDILSKMINVYSSAKTYQASLVSKESGKTKDGKPFSLTATQEIRYKAPNMVFVSMKQSGTGAATGKKPDGSPMLDTGKIVINSDGKTMIVYSESRKQYMKQNALPTIPLNQVFALLQRIPGPKTQGITLSMGAPATVGGRAAYVVAVKRSMPPNLTAAQQKEWQTQMKDAQPVRILIDKQNYMLLGINEVGKNGALDISFNSQAVNGALAANAFVFQPPAGAKEAKPQPQPASGGGGGSIPGLPGR